MKQITAFFTREQYADFVENHYLPHEVATTKNTYEGEEIIETAIEMTDQEFAKLLNLAGKDQ